MATLTCTRGHTFDADPDKPPRRCPLFGCPLPASRPAAPESRTSAGGPTTSGADPFARGPISVGLDVSSGLGRTRRFTLQPGDTLEIGRELEPLADLAGDNISAHHAEIRVCDDHVEVRDTGRDLRGSTNGTYVDGHRIPPNQPVRLDESATVTCAQDPPLSITVSIER